MVKLNYVKIFMAKLNYAKTMVKLSQVKLIIVKLNYVKLN